MHHVHVAGRQAEVCTAAALTSMQDTLGTEYYRSTYPVQTPSDQAQDRQMEGEGGKQAKKGLPGDVNMVQGLLPQILAFPICSSFLQLPRLLHVLSLSAIAKT